jgi:peptidyl-prolyl cis-trans isomerase B (cyclophilin B)
MQKRLLSLVAIAFVLISQSTHAQGPFTGKPQYQIEVRRADTVMGKIIVEMFPAIAPMSVRNWDSLVNIHFYDGTAFHRVIPGFMIQGGDPNSVDGDPSTWGYGDPSQTTVDAEFSAVSHRRGILSAARLGNDVNSATSQFFICVANDLSLDHQYSIYGQVVSGMAVADSIVKAPRNSNDRPLDKISMYITRIGSNDSVPPVPPSVMPPDGFNSTSQRMTFRWTLLPSVMMYDLQIATDSAFENIYADSTYSQVTSSASISKIPAGTYYWRMQANNGGQVSAYSHPMKFTIASSGVSESTAAGFSLEEPYPNPTTASSTIHFRLDRPSIVRLSLQDELGRTIRTLIDNERTAEGEHDVQLSSLAAGVYLYRLEANGQSAVRRLVVQ